jgi:hypothetical protein
MKLERNYQKEGTMPKGSGWEYYRANFEAGSIQVNNHTESGKWVYVLFLDTRIDCNDEYPTKKWAYSVALAHAVDRMEVSLRQLKSAQQSVVCPNKSSSTNR